MDVKSVCISLFTIGRRTESDRTADGIRSDGGRNPIGWRTESDWTADGIRLGGGRRRVWHPCHTHAIYQLSNSSNATRRLRGTVGGYGIPAIPTQSTNYQTVAMQQEGCVGMAGMPYPPNTEKAQSSALWALLLFGRCRIRGSGSSLSTLLLEERCRALRSRRASCRGARKT